MEQLFIVPMSEADIPELAQLEKCCFSHPWSGDGLGAEIEKTDALFLVGRDAAGFLCGYAGLNHVLDEGYIAKVAVHPDRRRQGVAQQLLQEMIRQGRTLGLSFLTLEVRVSNLSARGLYEKLGFRPVGLRKNFYEDIREDAILMTYYFSEQRSTT